MLVDPSMPLGMLSPPGGVRHALKALEVRTLGDLCRQEGLEDKTVRAYVLWVRAALDYLSHSNLQEMADHELLVSMLRRPWADVLTPSAMTAIWLERTVGSRGTLREVVDLAAAHLGAKARGVPCPVRALQSFTRRWEWSMPRDSSPEWADSR